MKCNNCIYFAFNFLNNEYGGSSPSKSGWSWNDVLLCSSYVKRFRMIYEMICVLTCDLNVMKRNWN